MVENKLYIYNTLSRQKELFVPLHPPFVGLYSCGPTVYSDVHLGNLRTFTTFDLVYRYLSFLGYKVRYVRNITDAGHTTNDAGDEQDRISQRAQIEQLEPMEIVQKYTVGFHQVCEAFNLLPPSIEPTATGHIIEQIEMIERIISNGYAYVVNGSVYFDVKKYAEKYDYGKLSGRKLEELMAGTRELEGQDEKRFFADFAIWKAVPPEHIQRWRSPWGDGTPGWHLECSAMGTKYLGKQIDIHGGGMDLKFPHHECEIAQSVGSDGIEPVRYWMHANMLTVNGEKMSKSKGNSFLPNELFEGTHPLLDKGYSPMVVRFFMMQTHYSSTLDFSNEALQGSEKGFQRLCEALSLLNQYNAESFGNGAENDNDKEILNRIESLSTTMNDDFNTPKMIAVLFDLASFINKIKYEALVIQRSTFLALHQNFNCFFKDILGLKVEQDNDDNITQGLMQLILEMRKEARDTKNWTVSDKIRDTLNALKIQVKDEKDGASWNKIR